MDSPQYESVDKYHIEYLVARDESTGGHHFLYRARYVGSGQREKHERRWWQSRERSYDPADLVNELVRCKDLAGLYDIARKYGPLVPRACVYAWELPRLNPSAPEGSRLSREDCDLIALRDLSEPSLGQLLGELYFDTDRKVREYPGVVNRVLGEHSLRTRWLPEKRDERMSSEPISDWITLRGILQAIGRVYAVLASFRDEVCVTIWGLMESAGFTHYVGAVTWWREAGYYHEDVDYSVKFPSNDDLYGYRDVDRYPPYRAHWFFRRIGRLSSDMLAVAREVIGRPVEVGEVPTSRYYSYKFAGERTRVLPMSDSDDYDPYPNSYGVRADLMEPEEGDVTAVDRVVEAGKWLAEAFPLLSRMCDTRLSEVRLEGSSTTSVDFVRHLRHKSGERNMYLLHFVFGCQALAHEMGLSLREDEVCLAVECKAQDENDGYLSERDYEYMAEIDAAERLAEFPVALIREHVEFDYDTMMVAALRDELKLGEMYRDITLPGDEAIASLFGHEGRRIIVCKNCGRISLAPAQGKPRQFCSASCQHMYAKRNAK